MIPLQTPPSVTAPAPPPAPAPALAMVDREIAFPGFNALPLKGSVRSAADPAKAAGWFAVMVAGPGPMDRDWSTPLLPVQSHGGRDLAAWLAAQGVGSLRFDKRLVGARDPKLDTSLDAQVGDIRAALAAARALPEAKGRKLLLVGFDEGALLSLLAASDADALLLIGLPPEPFGTLIEDQVARQLDGAPEGVRKANLAFLRGTLDAIRHGAAAPPAGDQIFPALARLGQSLMAPETLGFVRGTLDLDPWVLATRCPLPIAAVYGEADLQTTPPAQAPEGFHGALIRVPQANHLLKRETRDRTALSAALAVSAYGDDTPLADLDPVAAWLKQLK